MSFKLGRLPFFIFVPFFLFYFMTSSGGFESGDAVCRYEGAKSFLAGNGGALPPEPPLNSTTRGTGGRVFSTYGPMQSLLMVPMLAVFKALPIGEQKQEGLFRLTFNLFVVPAISALTLTLLFVALNQMGFSIWASFLTIFVLGVGTPFWHYGRSAHEENMVALGLVSWLLGTQMYLDNKKGGLLLSCVGACFALATRYAAAASLLPLFGVSVYVLKSRFRKEHLKELSVSAAICFIVVSFLMYYNHYRFGSPFESGYGLLFKDNSWPLFSFSEAPLRAIALLFSPYRGLLLYCPILIALFFLIKRKSNPSLLAWAGLGSLAGAFLLNAGYTYWTAGYSWGPRFLVAPLVLLAPLFATLLEVSKNTNWWKGILGVSIGVQFLSVVLPSDTEEIIRAQAGLEPFPVENAWKCNYTPLCLRPGLAIQALGNTFSGSSGEFVASGSKPKDLKGSDHQTLFWWPFRLAIRFGYFSRTVATLIVLLFGALTLTAFLHLRSLAKRESKG